MANSRKQEWKEKVWQPATERSGERQARFETSSEIEVEPIYTPEDVSNQDYDRDLGFPGSFPYTRGVQPTMLSRAYLDHAPILRLRIGGGDQPTLSLPP